jgi:ATP:ADP antiporter, AAA family
MTRFLGVRPEDGRTVWMACATLMTIVAAHAVLETARDALFLADLPAKRLPWAYLGIATLAFVTVRLSAPLAALGPPRRVLAGMLLVGAAGTASFWRLLGTRTATELMALYVWTGLLASVVVTQFWVQLGHRMDVGQARRAYAVVAAGGMLGATIGSLVATVVLTLYAPRMLLPVAAAMFALAACLPLLAGDGPALPEQAATEPVEPPPTARAIWADPYLKRLLPLAALAPIIAMAIDFVFKSVVTHSISRDALGPFFARYNVVVNGVALAFQLLVAPRLLQGIGVMKSLCLFPGTLATVATGVALTGGLPAALLLRGTDGVLRHSLHRAATEILFVPLTAATRTALRGLTESLGQRGGQVVGSLLILGAITLGATPQTLAAAVAVLCGLWLYGYVRLEHHYVDRFRTQLRTLATPDANVPALDVQSLETLVATLSAPNDAEVIAAMDVLATFGRTRLIPPLILYHPSPAVVVRGLALFEGVTREDVQVIRRRLLEHDDPAVRAAALRALAAAGLDPAAVRRVLRTDRSPLVRSTALVLWTATQDDADSDLDEAVADLLAAPDPTSRLAVATTLTELPGRLQVPVAQALLREGTPPIRRQVARALATDPDPSHLPLLTALLASPEARTAARAGLLAIGPPALEHLAAALASRDTPPALRRHLPRSISPFGSQRAADVLVQQLDRESDGQVLFKILRGLGRMRADDPSLQVDVTILTHHAQRTLERIIELLAYRVAHPLLRGTPNADVAPDDLLGQLLAEKESRALERTFRILQILQTQEDFATMHAALSSDVPATRAGARELLGHVLDGPLRDALLALTDSLPPAERLVEATRALPVGVADLALAMLRTPTTASAVTSAADGIVAALHADRSLTLAAIARHELHAALRETPRAAS